MGNSAALFLSTMLATKSTDENQAAHGPTDENQTAYEIMTKGPNDPDSGTAAAVGYVLNLPRWARALSFIAGIILGVFGILVVLSLPMLAMASDDPNAPALLIYAVMFVMTLFMLWLAACFLVGSTRLLVASKSGVIELSWNRDKWWACGLLLCALYWAIMNVLGFISAAADWGRLE